MPSDNTNREDTSPPLDERNPTAAEPEEGPLEGTFTEEDIREIEASGLTLGDVIRQLGLEAEDAAE